MIPTDVHIFQRGWNHQPAIISPLYSHCSAILFSTRFLAVNLIDRYMSSLPVLRRRLQLLGVPWTAEDADAKLLVYNSPSN